MRSILLMSCFIVLMAIAPAGAQQALVCDESLSFIPKAILRLPAKTDGLDYVVTALGMGNVDPVLAIASDEQDAAFCADDDPFAAFYGADLPSSGLVPPSEKAAQIIFQTAAETTLLIGDYANQDGEWLIAIEGIHFIEGTNRSQPIQLEITSAMAASDQPLVAYAIGLSHGYDPILAALNADGQPLTDDAGNPYQCDDAADCQIDLSGSVIALYDQEHIGKATDAALAIPLNEAHSGDTISFQVSAKEGAVGDFALLLHIASVDLATQQALATTADGEMGVALLCDARRASDNAVLLSFPNLPQGDYMATILGLGDSEPIAARFNADADEGLCYRAEGEIASYGANLPTTGEVPPSPNSVRIAFDGPTARLVIGDAQSLPAEFLVFLEGFATSETGRGAPLTLFISEGMATSGRTLAIYAVGADERIDPSLAQVDEALNVMTDAEGLTVQCEDAGIPDVCWGESTSLAGQTLLLDGVTLGMVAEDAMLSLPMSPELSGGAVNFLVTDAKGGQSPYIWILHIVTN